MAPVVAWGKDTFGVDSGSVSGLDSGVVQVFSNANAFAALKVDGSIVTWGADSAGDSSLVADELTGMVSIASISGLPLLSAGVWRPHHLCQPARSFPLFGASGLCDPLHLCHVRLCGE